MTESTLKTTKIQTTRMPKRAINKGDESHCSAENTAKEKAVLRQKVTKRSQRSQSRPQKKLQFNQMELKRLNSQFLPLQGV